MWLTAGGAVALSGGLTTAVTKSPQRRVGIAELKIREASAPARAKAPRLGVLFPGAGYANRGGSRSVRSLQRMLARAGDHPGPIDGLYGPLTEEAVIDLQAADGLGVDGIAGPQTLSALRQPLLYPGAGYAAPGGSASVRALQRRLITGGYNPGPVDGLYGPRTEHAVMRFQAAHRLHVDGIAGRQTFAALRARRSAEPAAHRPSAPARTAFLRVNAPRRHVRYSGLPVFSLALAAALGAALLLLALLALLRSHWNRERTPAPVATATRAPATSRFGEIAFERGAALEDRGDLEGAAAAYLQADRVGHPKAACRLGILLEQRGDLTGAEGAYRRAAQRGDSNGALHLASLLEEHGAVQQAILAYQRAARLGDAEATAHLGALLDERWESDRARVGSRAAGELEGSGAGPSAPSRGAVESNGHGRSEARQGGLNGRRAHQ